MFDKHELLCEQALKAISEVFSDKSVPAESTAASLKDLRDEIDMLLESLPEPDFDA